MTCTAAWVSYVGLPSVSSELLVGVSADLFRPFQNSAIADYFPWMGVARYCIL